ncbi:MAG: hypothetical protein J6Y92_05475, partial [Lentisphaeria bacterium]|nr:hypothetical protein [Lentisphaeria bacterium]
MSFIPSPLKSPAHRKFHSAGFATLTMRQSTGGDVESAGGSEHGIDRRAAGGDVGFADRIDRGVKRQTAGGD